MTNLKTTCELELFQNEFCFVIMHYYFKIFLIIYYKNFSELDDCIMLFSLYFYIEIMVGLTDV